MHRLVVLIGAAVAGVVVATGAGSSTAVRAQQVPEPVRSPVQFAIGYERVQAFAEAARLDLNHLPGEVVVKFRRGVGAIGQARALRGLRSRPTTSALRWVGDAAVLRDYTEVDPDILARQLRLQPEVQWAEPVYLRKAHAVPNDPSFAARQWNLTSIGMPDAWTIQPAAGRDVIVAVIDTGVTTVNETIVLPTWNGVSIQDVPMAFAVNPDMNPARLLPGRDFVFFLDGQPVLDLDGHGTHVAATIGQEANNNLYGAGLAYGATIMPLKACVGYWELQIVRSALGIPGYQPLSSGGCPTTAIAEAIRYAADNGAKIINLSLGGPTASQVERDAVEYAVGRGALVVAAAGNDFEDGNPVDYPAGFGAEIRGLIAVGAVGRGLQRSFYSATGTHVEVVAPGGDFRAGGPDGGIWQSTLRFADLNPSRVIFPRFDRYEEDAYQGTSMATPHVAGLGALLVAQGITRPRDVETLITRTARDIGGAGRDDQHGFGLIQPRAALYGMGIRR
jgi:serine protease